MTNSQQSFALCKRIAARDFEKTQTELAGKMQEFIESGLITDVSPVTISLMSEVGTPGMKIVVMSVTGTPTAEAAALINAESAEANLWSVQSESGFLPSSSHARLAELHQEATALQAEMQKYKDPA